MGRYERTLYFEALCEMRERYTERSADDRTGTLLLEDAILYAEAILLAIETENALEAAEAAALAADEAQGTAAEQAGADS